MKQTKKTAFQLQKLEESYRVSNRPCGFEQALLAKSIGLTPGQVSSWFCGRRNKDYKKRNKGIKRVISNLQVWTDDDDSGHEGSQFRSDSGAGGQSDSSRLNVSLEAANILGQIASQKNLPQTLTPMEIESQTEKVVTEVACHVDTMPVEIKENSQMLNVNGGRDHGSPSKLCLASSSKMDSCQVKGLVGDHVGSGGVDVNGDGDGDEDEIKGKMINMLVEKNKRDKAKRRSLLDEITLLEKCIEDRDKLIDDIKRVR